MRDTIVGVATAPGEGGVAIVRISGEQAVALLSRAETVHVAGFRRAFPVASYLSYVFDKMSVPSMLHDGVGKLDHRHALRQGDALVAITFLPNRAADRNSSP